MRAFVLAEPAPLRARVAAVLPAGEVAAGLANELVVVLQVDAKGLGPYDEKIGPLRALADAIGVDGAGGEHLPPTAAAADLPDAAASVRGPGRCAVGQGPAALAYLGVGQRDVHHVLAFLPITIPLAHLDASEVRVHPVLGIRIFEPVRVFADVLLEIAPYLIPVFDLVPLDPLGHGAQRHLHLHPRPPLEQDEDDGDASSHLQAPVQHAKPRILYFRIPGQAHRRDKGAETLRKAVAKRHTTQKRNAAEQDRPRSL
mmetsp:Transcript_18986/g.54423  ORF Transcript_18986/g.54423 Transcript_18986/m.54423 type:complete len:257 (-) Transcript_18986:23-793(-)